MEVVEENGEMREQQQQQRPRGEEVRLSYIFPRELPYFSDSCTLLGFSLYENGKKT